jgi:hypothetical protein
MTRSERLAAFTKRFSDAPIWGVDECTAGPAQWVREEGHQFDLPAYSSRAEAQAIIARYGSLAETWDALLGLPERCGDPELGDVAVIELFGQIGGICANGRIMILRNEAGGWSWFGPVRRFVKIWAVPSLD